MVLAQQRPDHAVPAQPRRQPLGLLKILTPLESLESGCFQSILAGFAVLTLALVSGAFFVQDLFAQHLIHKVVLGRSGTNGIREASANWVGRALKDTAGGSPARPSHSGRVF